MNMVSRYVAGAGAALALVGALWLTHPSDSDLERRVADPAVLVETSPVDVPSSLVEPSDDDSSSGKSLGPEPNEPVSGEYGGPPTKREGIPGVGLAKRILEGKRDSYDRKLVESNATQKALENDGKKGSDEWVGLRLADQIYNHGVAETSFAMGDSLRPRLLASTSGYWMEKNDNGTYQFDTQSRITVEIPWNPDLNSHTLIKVASGREIDPVGELKKLSKRYIIGDNDAEREVESAQAETLFLGEGVRILRYELHGDEFTPGSSQRITFLEDRSFSDAGFCLRVSLSDPSIYLTNNDPLVTKTIYFSSRNVDFSSDHSPPSFLVYEIPRIDLVTGDFNGEIVARDVECIEGMFAFPSSPEKSRNGYICELEFNPSQINVAFPIFPQMGCDSTNLASNFLRYAIDNTTP